MSLMALWFNAPGLVLLREAGWIAAAAAVVLAAWVTFCFNRLVRYRNLVREGWSGIDVQLTRRWNLIPSLVETVKGYSRHEHQVLEEVAALRTQGRPPRDLKERQTRENALTDGLKGLFALVEQYPQLKANENFLGLQQQLGEIEDQIQMARRYYNGAVREYNIRVESFPSNLIAGAFGFGREEFFEVETATQRQAPQVEMQQ